MAKNVNGGISEEQVTNPQEEVLNDSNDMTLVIENENNQKDIIKKLINSGCKKIMSLHVKNVNYDEFDDYTRVSFTLKEKVRGFVGKKGVFTLGYVGVVFCSTFNIAAVLRENEDYAWLSKNVIDNPKCLLLILGGATIDIIQQEVLAGEEYINPFTTNEEAEPIVFDHDVIINHLINIKFSKKGESMINQLALMMLQ